MILYRACKPKYKDKLDGEGAKRTGGRWNKPGTAINYLADSKDTIRAELKGRDFDPKKVGYVFIEIEVLDNLPMVQLTREMLDGTFWDMDDYEDEQCPSQDIGSELLLSDELAIIKVPSARCDGFNYLLNPNYEGIKDCYNIIGEEDFDW